jgi:hypothetical protein
MQLVSNAIAFIFDATGSKGMMWEMQHTQVPQRNADSPRHTYARPNDLAETLSITVEVSSAVVFFFNLAHLALLVRLHEIVIN